MAPDRALRVSSLALAATPATAGVDCMVMVLLSFSTLVALVLPAAKGLYDVMKTNLGPKGTIKMLVGGAGGAQPSLARQTRLRSQQS